MANSTYKGSHMLYSMPPSKVAVICVAGARQQLSIQPVWPMRLNKLTNYNWNEFELEITNLFNLDISSEDKLKAELESMLKMTNYLLRIYYLHIYTYTNIC